MLEELTLPRVLCDIKYTYWKLVEFKNLSQGSKYGIEDYVIISI